MGFDHGMVASGIQVAKNDSHVGNPINEFTIITTS
jgi:hypothetical protein